MLRVRRMNYDSVFNYAAVIWVECDAIIIYADVMSFDGSFVMIEIRII